MTILDEEKNNPKSRCTQTPDLLWLGPASMSLTSFAQHLQPSSVATPPLVSTTCT